MQDDKPASDIPIDKPVSDSRPEWAVKLEEILKIFPIDEPPKDPVPEQANKRQRVVEPAESSGCLSSDDDSVLSKETLILGEKP